MTHEELVEKVASHIALLEWDKDEVELDDGWFCCQAHTEFGSLSVDLTPGNGWRWRYCFDEYYDEDYESCDGFEDGKAKAQAYYRERIEADKTAKSIIRIVGEECEAISQSFENFAEGRTDTDAGQVFPPAIKCVCRVISADIRTLTNPQKEANQ